MKSAKQPGSSVSHVNMGGTKKFSSPIHRASHLAARVSISTELGISFFTRSLSDVTTLQRFVAMLRSCLGGFGDSGRRRAGDGCCVWRHGVHRLSKQRNRFHDDALFLVDRDYGSLATVSFGQSSQCLQYDPNDFVTDSISIRPAPFTNQRLRRRCRSTAK